MVMLTIVLLNTTHSWKIKLTAILWYVTYYTDYYHRLTLESWFANLERHHWSPQLTVTGTVYLLRDLSKTYNDEVTEN